MDEAVLRAIAKWPDVPDVYGWLALDRRGNWLLQGEKIGNQALKEFISRNYATDARGRWYFQNGPQRVFVQLVYTPLVLHLEGEDLVDHCGRGFGGLRETLLDDEGSIVLAGAAGAGVLDDRDLARYAERLGDACARLPRISRREVAARFGFVANPRP